MGFTTLDGILINGPCLPKPGSRLAGWMIPTDEDQVIARYTLQLLQTAAGLPATQKKAEG